MYKLQYVILLMRNEKLNSIGFIQIIGTEKKCWKFNLEEFGRI